MINVYQDCFSSDIVQLIEDICTCTSLSWKSSNRKLSSVDDNSDLDKGLNNDKNMVNSIQLVHDISNENMIYSPMFHIIKRLIIQFVSYLNVNDNKLCKELFGSDLNIQLSRVKANLIPQQIFEKEIKYNPPHRDPQPKTGRMLIALYYVNQSDGDTFFFDNNLKIYKRISPKRGSLVIFDGDIIHASSPPQISRSRMVINFNIALPN